MEDILKWRQLKLRKNPSLVEKIMWTLLRNRKLNGFKFRRQHIIEPYIVDFICLQKMLIIEMDGDHHAFQIAYDAKRTKYLNSLGYKVIRFQNADVLNDRVDQILTTIVEELTA